MNKARLEAFSDGVLAIIITIMVLEIKVPHEAGWASIKPLLSVLYSYILSYLFVGIYWVNHHHLLHTVKKVTGKILWANLHFLFWLSLTPVATGWMGENHFATNTVVVYAILLLLCGVGYTVLEATIRQSNIHNTAFEDAFKSLRRKGKISIIIYVSSIPLAYINTAISGLLFLVVAILWLIPERKIEKAIGEE